MGRKALPTEVKELRGTTQKCRTNPDEPKYTKVIDVGGPPADLSDEGREIWQLITEEMLNVGTLQTPDIDLVTLLCYEYQDYYESLLILNNRGKYFIDPKTNLKKIRPAYKVKTTALTNILKLVGELGLSPSTRSRIKAPTKKKTKNKDAAAGIIA